MCQRAEPRVAFGKTLAEQGSVREDIAQLASATSSRRAC